MTYQALRTEIGQLPVDPKVALPEELTRSLRTKLRPPTPGESSAHGVRGLLKPTGPTDIGMCLVESEL